VDEVFDSAVDLSCADVVEAGSVVAKGRDWGGWIFGVFHDVCDAAGE
jgi:hypothetical protein